MTEQKHVRTIFISDIHLGNPKNHADKLLKFLKSISTENLIICWDFIDSWQLSHLWKRMDKDSKLLNYINSIAHKWTNVFYIQWNHDKKIPKLHRAQLKDIPIMKEMFYTTKQNKKFYITHGDCIDKINSWYAIMGKTFNFLYSIMLKIENIFNKKTMNPDYLSLTERLVQRVKKYRYSESNFIKKISKLSEKVWCNNIILWHYHQLKHIISDNIEYFNTWDWLNNCTAILESSTWSLELFSYKE